MREVWFIKCRCGHPNERTARQLGLEDTCRACGDAIIYNPDKFRINAGLRCNLRDLD